MTLLAAQSFEGWGDSLPDRWLGATSTFWSTTNVHPRTGSTCWNDGGSSRWFGYSLQDSEQDSTLIAGFAFWTAGASEIMTFWGDTNNSYGAVFPSATQHITLYTNGSDLEVYRGSHLGTLLGSAPNGTIIGGTWNYIEMKVHLSDTVGSVVVRKDETIVINLSGIDTKNGGTETTFDLVNCSGTSSGAGDFFDDFYICNTAGSTNNDFLGAIRVERLYPSGNGNSSQWVNEAGNSTNNYSHVNSHASDITASYVESSTTNNEDTYVTDNSAFSTADVVAGVIIHSYAEKTDAGARGLTFVARLSGTETTVASEGSLTNGIYKDVWGIMETKPGGGSWTVADVNNSEFGIKAT